ncbi:MAG: RNA methyltransferase [Ginsengibacter sp.]
MLTKKVVKYIQSLTHKKFREEEGVFVAEGPKVIAEFLLEGSIECDALYGEKYWIETNPHLINLLSSDNVTEIDAHFLERISHLKTPNQVVGIFKKPNPEYPDVKDKISIMLDDLQDPGNMGTIIRTADWFGIENIICSENSVDCFNQKVVQATMGSLLRINVFYTDLISFMNKNAGIKLYATALEGNSIYEMDKIKEAIIIIGNESKGIRDELFQFSSEKINIPRIGKAESLNAAVATGIILAQFRK